MITLLLLACSSVTLLDSDAGDSVRLDALADESACYATCDRLWRPMPECADMVARSNPAITIEACQADCDRAEVYIDAIHAYVDVYWSEAVSGYIPDYGCEVAVQQLGQTPCSHAEAYCLPAE